MEVAYACKLCEPIQRKVFFELDEMKRCSECEVEKLNLDVFLDREDLKMVINHTIQPVVKQLRNMNLRTEKKNFYERKRQADAIYH